ncbi:Serine/threonine protein kinase [Giardia duodenalis]|uniref:Serine/threonine protein kinase n=1 Tax=Giardia intestinalis TaxID=5741 RepID=V6TV54_GIAIN|nr:Serine/threonine protein kinase [Giardia intestinalis]
MSGGSDRAPTFGASELLGLMEHRLGGGAFGTVYSLRDHPSLAVKEIRLDGLDDRLARNAEFELSALARLSHPGILRCHQVIVDDSFAYVVTDRYHDTLGSVIISHMRARKAVPRELLLSIVRQVTSALAYLHSARGTGANEDPYQGVVHRDLKPDNVLVSEDGSRVVLADFGLCKDALRSGTTLAGTKPYMAPETLLSNKTSRASDIWSLGVIVYELTTLRRPNFLGDKEPRHVFTSGWKPDLSAIEDDSVRIILERIFVLDPAKRPTANELADIFQASSISPEGHSPHITAWEAALKDANVRIDTSKNQCKEHSTTTRALENKIALLTINNPQSELLLLPQLMRAAHTNSIETVRMLVEGGDGVGKRDEQGRTALMHAAQQGHVEPARLLVEKEKGLQDRNGWTALMHAAHNNHLEVVEILAAHERGNRDVSNRTALMIAAERGYAEIVAALAPHEKGLADSSGNTALMLAANNAHIETVRRLAEHERGARDSRNRTALMTAAQRGDLEMVRILAEHEKGITDEDGRTALVHAARAGHRDIAELLMEHEKDVTGWTMLMCVAALGDVDMVSQHIDERSQKDKRGQTALIIAAQNRRDEAVKLLVKHEGGVSGWTSLICAAYLGDVDVVKNNLHEKGCKDITGMTALMWAALSGHKECVRLLFEKEGGMRDIEGNTALMVAAARGHEQVLELLVEHEGGMQDADGRTALMYAVRTDHPGCVKLLVEKESGMQDKNGTTALMLAAVRGHEQVVELLKEEVGMQDVGGRTALMAATFIGHIDCVRLLLEHEGAMQDKNGWTALMLAALTNSTKCISLLLEKEGGVQDTGGHTALMYAVQFNNKDAAKLLLEKEVGIQNNVGWTALMFAVESDNIECVKLLMEREKDIKDTSGITALDIAMQGNHKEVISIFR